MRVLILSPFGTAINPYIGLLREGLLTAGAEVGEARTLEPSHLAPGSKPDVIHLHWIEQYDRPPLLQPGAVSRPLRWAARVALRLVNTGPGYGHRRSLRLRALFHRLDAFRQSGGRVVFTVHNLDPHEAGSWPDRWALGKIIEIADVLHVHDAATAEAIGQRYGRENGLVVIPHGHYIGTYPNAISQTEARARLAIPSGTFVYACLGLMRPYKGLEELLPAFRQLQSEDLRLLIAGRPADPAYLQRLRALADSDSRILIEPRFIQVEEVQVYLNAADIAVLPYRQITTSGAALLAFSFGLPVIAPAIGAFPSLAAAERGVLYAPGQLLEAMRAAQSVDWSASRMSTITWAAQFDWGEIGRRLMSAYSK